MGARGINHVTWTLMLRRLMERAWTRGDLAEELGLTPTVTGYYLSALSGQRLIHIRGWRLYVRTWVAEWAWGPDMPNAPRPKAPTYAERTARRLPHGSISSGIGIMAESRKSV